MVLYLLVFFGGGFIGILLMSILFLGRKEDDLSSEVYKKFEISNDNPDRVCSVDAMATESD